MMIVKIVLGFIFLLIWAVIRMFFVTWFGIALLVGLIIFLWSNINHKKK